MGDAEGVACCGCVAALAATRTRATPESAGNSGGAGIDVRRDDEPPHQRTTRPHKSHPFFALTIIINFILEYYMLAVDYDEDGRGGEVGGPRAVRRARFW